MKINKQQKICDVNDCYKTVSFINEEFLSNKVLWTCEKHKDLLNHTKDKNQKLFYQKLENSKIIFDDETGLLKCVNCKCKCSTLFFFNKVLHLNLQFTV